MPKHSDESSENVVFMCTMCKKIYKDAGMCKHCDVVLKPKGG